MQCRVSINIAILPKNRPAAVIEKAAIFVLPTSFLSHREKFHKVCTQNSPVLSHSYNSSRCKVRVEYDYFRFMMSIGSRKGEECII